MSFEEDLFTQLNGYPGLKALIGSKIYPDYIPQTVEAPFVRYVEIYREKNHVYGGYNGTSIISIQLSAYAATREQVRRIAEQISLAMEAWPRANHKVGFAVQKNEVSTWLEELNLFAMDMDFDVFYTD